MGRVRAIGTGQCRTRAHAQHLGRRRGRGPHRQRSIDDEGRARAEHVDEHAEGVLRGRPGLDLVQQRSDPDEMRLDPRIEVEPRRIEVARPGRMHHAVPPLHEPVVPRRLDGDVVQMRDEQLARIARTGQRSHGMRRYLVRPVTRHAQSLKQTNPFKEIAGKT
jgi:hypothetical protein